VEVRPVEVDGSPERVAQLVDALAAALEGGPPVLPLPVGAQAPVVAAPAGTAVVIATSGSTGEPKLVALSAAALRASARATEARLGGPARWLLALPAEHVAGVQVIVRALLAGAAPVVLDLRGGFRPDRFAAVTAALGPGRRYTSLVPTQLRRILDAAAALDALRSYAAVLVGGAALDAGTRERARAAGVRVVTTYGMTETAGGCVYDGVPLDGVTVDLDSDGRILLDSPTLASGYLRPEGARTSAAGSGPPEDDPTTSEPPNKDPTTSEPPDDGRTPAIGEVVGTDGQPTSRPGDGEPTSRPGGGRPEDAAFEGGRFRTGDLGRWRDGRLEVLGRADDVIVTGARLVAPAAVESVLALQPGVRAACVTSLPDAEWGQIVVAAVVWDAPDDDEALRKAVRAALGRAAVPRRIVAVAEIPLRGIGKPDRAAVARLVAAATEDGHQAR
jgi:o-succinylbenzoate---CoA ligase